MKDDEVTLRAGVTETLAELDRRGILLSIASKNEKDEALHKLGELGLTDYFLAPQIGWGSKADSVAKIAQMLNIGLDTFAFIDDRPSERVEVSFYHPEVRAYDAGEYLAILSYPEFMPQTITEESRLRRQMYRDDLERAALEERFEGSKDEFLKTLGMKLSLGRVEPGDLERVEELTVRTNQLNSTGATFSFEELTGFIGSPSHLFLIAGLTDKFGDYGKIGLVLAERSGGALTIKLLIMSCRVMTRGVGSALLAWTINYARDSGCVLEAEFVPTPRNRIMYITYKLMGFEEAGCDADRRILQYRGGGRAIPDYLELDASV